VLGVDSLSDNTCSYEAVATLACAMLNYSNKQ